MMKPLAIQFQFEPETLKLAVALLEREIGLKLNDKTVEEKFIDRPIVIIEEKDLGDQALQMCVAFCAQILGKDID